MKHLMMLAFIAVLSACVSATQQKSESVVEGKTTVQKQEKAAHITTAAYITEQENKLKSILKDSPFKIVRYKNILQMSFAGKDIFAPNSYRPEAKAVETLKKVADVLAVYDKTRISIIGYTENSGKPSTNQLMSEKRAEAVASVLEESAKIADVRFWIEGRGAADNKAEEGRHTNNRVDIVLTPTFVR